jgi:hypothetical protein
MGAHGWRAAVARLIKAHRQKLLAALTANSGATRSQLRRELAASSVRYLARRDLDWLVRVLPAPKKYDWPEKDRRLAEAVPAAAHELLMGPAPARRVTATRIARQISTDDWIFRNRRRLPRTIAVIRAHAETALEANIRRIEAAYTGQVKAAVQDALSSSEPIGLKKPRPKA